MKIKKSKNQKMANSKNSFGKDLNKDFIWVPKLSVEEPTIDKQHQRLLIETNKLKQDVLPGAEINAARDALHFLEFYVKEHFSYEESYMAKIKFPGLKKHQVIHNNFVEYFLNFKKTFNKHLYSKNASEDFVSDKLKTMVAELRDYLGNWLIHHMMGDDQEYHKYAAEKKLIGKEKLSTSSEIIKSIKDKLINQQRKPLKVVPNLKGDTSTKVKDSIYTQIPGFDELLDQGIPRGNSIIVAGGAGSGKTIFCLQLLANKALEGKKCLYLSLEESEDKLIQHMNDFGWNPSELIKSKKLKILRINPFDITRNVDAMLAKQKGELLIDIDPVLLPEDYSKPDFIIIDSLTAIASTFAGKEDSYRIYIEQLFRFLEKTKATSFLITETEQVPKIFSQTGVEEFLADGVIVLYSIKHANLRENAIEILKLRGAKHQKKIVAMQVTSEGIVVYPEQEVFSEL